jgi:hypothetical protein
MSARGAYGTRITKRSRLLCPSGCGLQFVAFIFPASYGGDPLTNTVVTLRCRHTRGEILPVRQGCVSFEDFDTVQGDLSFPVVGTQFKECSEWMRFV